MHNLGIYLFTVVNELSIGAIQGLINELGRLMLLLHILEPHNKSLRISPQQIQCHSSLWHLLTLPFNGVLSLYNSALAWDILPHQTIKPGLFLSES